MNFRNLGIQIYKKSFININWNFPGKYFSLADFMIGKVINSPCQDVMSHSSVTISWQSAVNTDCITKIKWELLSPPSSLSNIMVGPQECCPGLGSVYPTVSPVTPVTPFFRDQQFILNKRTFKLLTVTLSISFLNGIFWEMVDAKNFLCVLYIFYSIFYVLYPSPQNIG